MKRYTRVLSLFNVQCFIEFRSDIRNAGKCHELSESDRVSFKLKLILDYGSDFKNAIQNTYVREEESEGDENRNNICEFIVLILQYTQEL